MYNLDGFAFASREDVKQAKKESEQVLYIKEHTDMSNPDIVFKLYHKVIEEELFHTVIGYQFLGEMRSFLYSIPGIRHEDIAPIPIYDTKADEERMDDRRAAYERKKQQEKKMAGQARMAETYRKRFHITLFFTIVFAAVIIGMFVITYASGENINIFNYENELIDRYESWQQQLTEKETELNEREREIELREQKLLQQNGQE